MSGADVPLTLCWGTVMGSPLVELVDVAAGAGFTGVAITPVMYAAALASGATPADLRRRLDDRGVAVTVLDPVLAPLPGAARAEEVGRRFRALFEVSEDDCYAVAEALAVPVLNAAHYLGRPTPLAELVDGFGALCERAARRGLDVLLEPMPEGGVRDLAAGLAIVRGAGAPNGALMLDTWHFHRTGGTPDALDDLAPGELGGLQVSDAPAVRTSSPTTGLLQREVPGAGTMALPALLDRALTVSPRAVVSVEVFNDVLARLPAAEAARRAGDAMRAVLALARPAPNPPEARHGEW